MDKIQNTFNRTIDQIEKYSKVYRESGKLEQAVAQDKGDIAWFNDIRDALEALMHALEEAQMSHGVALQFATTNEAVTESKLTEGVLDSDDDDGFMARSQLYFLAKDAISLHGAIDDRDDLEPWVQTKIVQASKDIDAVRRYTEYNAMKQDMPQQEELPAEMPAEMPMGMEESVTEDLEQTGRNRGGADLTPSQIQKLDKTGKNKTMRRYVNKKLAVDAKMNKANDPGGEKKGLGPAVVDKKKAQDKADKRKTNEAEDTTEYGIVRYPDTAISYIKNDGNGWEHIFDKSYGFEGPVDKADLQYAKKIKAEKVPGRLRETSELEEGKLANIALAALLGWGSIAALDATSAKHSPLGQALAYAAEQGDERAEELYNNIDAYAEHKAGTLHNWKIEHEDLVSQFDESVVSEGMEFDDSQDAELKTVATDMFKSVLGKAKKNAKGSIV